MAVSQFCRDSSICDVHKISVAGLRYYTCLMERLVEYGS